MAIFRDIPQPTPDRFRIRDRRLNPNKHVEDLTRGAEFFQLHNNGPDQDPRASNPWRFIFGWNENDRSRIRSIQIDSNSSNVSQIVEAVMTDLAIPEGDYQSCLQVRHDAQIRQLIEELKQALYERDSTLIRYAHHDLQVSENAMHQRY